MAAAKRSWEKVSAALRAAGGRRSSLPRPDFYAAALARRGRQFLEPVRLRRMVRHQCHRNSAEVWAQDVRGSTLCKGYGLCEGRWLEHSWVLREGHLVETTYRMEAYYGVELSPEEASEAWLHNFLLARYPGPASLLFPDGE
jgi:hypothetical protein